MDRESTELCAGNGFEADTSLFELVSKPDATYLTIGGTAIRHIRRINHTNDGFVRVDFVSGEPDNVLGSFRYRPGFEQFATTAVKLNGDPACTNCSEPEA